MVRHGHADRHGVGYILICKQQEVDRNTGYILSIHEISKPSSTVTHCLQRDHTTPTRSYLPIMPLSLGAFFFLNNHIWQALLPLSHLFSPWFCFLQIRSYVAQAGLDLLTLLPLPPLPGAGFIGMHQTWASQQILRNSYKYFQNCQPVILVKEALSAPAPKAKTVQQFKKDRCYGEFVPKSHRVAVN